MVDRNGIPLRFGDKVYIVIPDFSLVREIEHELGGLAALRENFSRQGWTISDLVTLIHMMLQAAGETVDYLLLGDTMLREGLGRYLAAALAFLGLILRD